ncbi:MAG: GIY-YIG nuclease family protein [Anaerolineae bacterium]
MLQGLGFSESTVVEGRESIADLFRPNKRCGIYVLHFANDEYYVGQAVDITRRYVQHRHNHQDICELFFKQVQQQDLNESERSAIWAFESAGAILRNITFVSVPRYESDFDLIMSPTQQESWLSDLAFVDSEGKRPVNPELRNRYAKRFDRFQRLRFTREATDLLHEYVLKGVPAIKRGEISFWSCSCLPAFRRGIIIYSRINVNWQEVFTISEENRELNISWHLARQPLEQAFGKTLKALGKQYRLLEWGNHWYEPGGFDQINLFTRDIQTASNLMHNSTIQSAIRSFNLRLMRKGPCTYNRYHCLDLADRVIGPD